jgi:hypothetical protein
VNSSTGTCTIATTKHTAKLTEQRGGDGITGQEWDGREMVEGRQGGGCMPPPACSCTLLPGKWRGSRVAGAKGNQDPHCMLVCPWVLQIAQIINQIQCTLQKLSHFIVDDNECGLVAVSLTPQWCAPALHGPASSLISHINHLGAAQKSASESTFESSTISLQLQSRHWDDLQRGCLVCIQPEPQSQLLNTQTTPSWNYHLLRTGIVCHEQLILTFKDTVKGLTTDADCDFLYEVWLE